MDAFPGKMTAFTKNDHSKKLSSSTPYLRKELLRYIRGLSIWVIVKTNYSCENDVGTCKIHEKLQLKTKN